MAVNLKYAYVERERRFLVAELPAGVVGTKLISDRYIVGTRMRLREVIENGAVTRKLCHKVRLGDGPADVACTNFYLDGTLLAEIDDGDAPPVDVPEWLPVTTDVSHDEAWTGASLTRGITADK